MKVETPRDTVSQGHVTLAIFGWVLLGISVLASALALLPVESLVLRRLSRLSKDVQQVSLQNGGGQRVRPQGNDELGHLAADINATLQALETADHQRAHLQQLHQEMAQTALAAGDCFFVATAPRSDTKIADSDIALEWHGNISRLLGLREGEFPRTLEAWKTHVHPEGLGTAAPFL